MDFRPRPLATTRPRPAYGWMLVGTLTLVSFAFVARLLLEAD